MERSEEERYISSMVENSKERCKKKSKNQRLKKVSLGLDFPCCKLEKALVDSTDKQNVKRIPDETGAVKENSNDVGIDKDTKKIQAMSQKKTSPTQEKPIHDNNISNGKYM